MIAPWRTGDGPRPVLPLPPQKMRLLRGGRPLKRWRYVGVYTEDVMLCVATAHIGPVPLAWWAVWDRGARTLVEHTVRGRGPVRWEAGGRVHVDDGPVTLDLTVAEDAGVETVSPHGEQYIWTRKQGGVPVIGTVRVLERRIDVDATAIVDESAGYHARETAWLWSAGVGRLEDGRAVAWNLVTGVHDAPEASERTLWIEREPHHLPPCAFAGDLSAVSWPGAQLRFSGEATRAQDENLVFMRSAYEQPFGTFEGELPQGRVNGYGVMERHDVRW